MDIDRTGISSLDAGASDITYSGNEGPKSPQEEQQMQMASLMQEYKDYVMQQEEAGRPAMPFEEWVRSIQSPMAEGGIARLGYANGQLVQPGPGRPGYGGPHETYDTGKSYEKATQPGGEGADRWQQQALEQHRTEQQAQGKGAQQRAAEEEAKRYKESARGKREIEEAAARNKKLAKIRSIKPRGTWLQKLGYGALPNNPKHALEFLTTLKDEDQEAWDSLPQELKDLIAVDQSSAIELTGENPELSYDDWSSLTQVPGYGEFLKERGKPGVLHGGDLSGVGDRYVIRDPITKEPIKDKYGNVKYGYHESTGGRGDGPANQYPYYIPPGTTPGDETDETAEWEAPEIPVDPIRFAADGGRIGRAYGGIMGDDGRRAYGLGSIFKKAARAIKKVVKSPIGKMALMGGLGAYGMGFGPFASGSTMFGGKLAGLKGSGFLANMMGKDLTNKLFMKNLGSWDSPLYKGKGAGLSLGKLGLMGGALYPLIKGMGDDEDDDFTQTDLYKRWLAQKQGWDKTFAPVGDPANWQPIRFADGGRIGYDNGGYLYDEEEEDHRSAALSAMYRSGAQEGGLMDLGGMEKDYRNDGGFVPIGGQERADDVPARLSKNEFVFTADAVRAAGGGDIDKGAEIMENVMENLEQGGNVSEESQGLEGARNMFATSQRLEGVL